MMLFLNIKTVLGVLGLYELLWIIYCRYFHPLRRIPGPFLASVSRTWIVWKTMRGDMEHTQRSLHAKHGYLVRIAPNEVACSDPDAIKIIYGIKGGFTKTDYYDAWAPPGGGYPGHFPERDEKVHAERRRIVQNAYSMSSVLESESSVDACTRIFCDTMREFAREKSIVDLGQFLHMYAFDVLGELFYGEIFGFMHTRSDYKDYMSSLSSMLPTFTIGGTLPSYITPFILPLTLLMPSARGAISAIKHIDASSHSAVQRRKQELEDQKDDKRDILRKMLEISADRGEKVDFTTPHVVIESTSSLFAGSDTTAIAFRSIFYHLMRHPAALNRLHDEIDAAASAAQLSNPVTYAEATKLPYLTAVVKEGMRLHPSVGLTMPRHVPAGGARISGFFIPAGYRVGMNGAVVQHDREIFGDDADAFRPERWLDAEAAAGMEKAMLIFGAGTRTCIGKNISLAEIYKLTAQFLREFDVRLVRPEREWETHNYWFNKQTGIHIYVEERGPRKVV